jgi:trimeric autotransporter adhesin
VSIIQQMSGGQISDLTAAQIAALGAQQIGALSAAQAADLSAGQLAALGAGVQSLSNAALAGLSNADLLAIYPDLTSQQISALSSTQQAAVQNASSAVSTLVNNLSSNGILSEVQSTINSGDALFSYTGLVSVLNGVSATIGSSGLTQAQMTDLQTLPQACGNVEAPQDIP